MVLFVTVWLDYCTESVITLSNLTHLKAAPSQATLVDGLRANQPWAYRQLQDDYASNLLKYLLKVVKDQAEAEDLLQETFIKVWQHIATYDLKRAGFSTWLFKIAHNNALDHLRSRKMLHSLDPDYELNSPAYTPTYNCIGIAELVTRCLSPNQQQIIDLLYFKGYTMQEAAIHLKLPLGTVKTHSRLAIQRFRPLFK